MVRELPNSQPLEQALLGSLMIYPSVMQECMDLDLQPIEFYLPAHQRLFACMQEIVSTGQRLI